MSTAVALSRVIWNHPPINRQARAAIHNDVGGIRRPARAYARKAHSRAGRRADIQISRRTGRPGNARLGQADLDVDDERHATLVRARGCRAHALIHDGDRGAA